MKLADAPGGADYISKDEEVLNRGRSVFAENCATCHSSKQPPAEIRNRAAWFDREINEPGSLSGNFLSDETRHPITPIKTNAARACATNAARGHPYAALSYDATPSQRF